MRDKDMVFDFLMGLDESFGTVRSQILSIDPLPNLGRSYAIIAQEEKQTSITIARGSTLESTSLAAFHHSSGNATPSRSVGNGRGQKMVRDEPKCSHCNKTRHVKDQCFERRSRVGRKINQTTSGGFSGAEQPFAGTTLGTPLSNQQISSLLQMAELLQQLNKVNQLQQAPPSNNSNQQPPLSALNCFSGKHPQSDPSHDQGFTLEDADWSG
ncbi:hypothetical protein Scep_023975 [Stephania cephalantha]|uniref:Uncharacterized protein n=1 Tax=Stephania cephalantha TaxID=152367 RepID=A0AAP0HXZ9_9MAGN